MYVDGELNLSMRVVALDYYMEPYPREESSTSYGRASASTGQQVPVIRLWGTTEGGQKICSHVHGVLPYLYVPYPADQSFDHRTEYMKQLSASLDARLAEKDEAMRAARTAENAGNAAPGSSAEHAGAAGAGGAGTTAAARPSNVAPKKKYVFKMVLTQRIPYYGYHDQKQFFIQIFFFHPNYISPAALLLSANGIQPYEAHIPYLLHFFIDYNIVGMGLVKFRKLRIREALPDVPDWLKDEVHMEREALRKQTQTGVSAGSREEIPLPTTYYNILPLPLALGKALKRSERKVSRCELEIDVEKEDIGNVDAKIKDPLQHGIPLSTSFVPSLKVIWEEERKRRMAAGERLSEMDMTPSSSQARNVAPPEGVVVRVLEQLKYVQAWDKERLSKKDAPEVDPLEALKSSDGIMSQGLPVPVSENRKSDSERGGGGEGDDVIDFTQVPERIPIEQADELLGTATQFTEDDDFDRDLELLAAGREAERGGDASGSDGEGGYDERPEQNEGPAHEFFDGDDHPNVEQTQNIVIQYDSDEGRKDALAKTDEKMGDFEDIEDWEIQPVLSGSQEHGNSSRKDARVVPQSDGCGDDSDDGGAGDDWIPQYDGDANDDGRRRHKQRKKKTVRTTLQLDDDGDDDAMELDPPPKSKANEAHGRHRPHAAGTSHAPRAKPSAPMGAPQSKPSAPSAVRTARIQVRRVDSTPAASNEVSGTPVNVEAGGTSEGLAALARYIPLQTRKTGSEGEGAAGTAGVDVIRPLDSKNGRPHLKTSSGREAVGSRDASAASAIRSHRPRDSDGSTDMKRPSRKPDIPVIMKRHKTSDGKQRVRRQTVLEIEPDTTQSMDTDVDRSRTNKSKPISQGRVFLDEDADIDTAAKPASIMQARDSVEGEYRVVDNTPLAAGSPVETGKLASSSTANQDNLFDAKCPDEILAPPSQGVAPAVQDGLGHPDVDGERLRGKETEPGPKGASGDHEGLVPSNEEYVPSHGNWARNEVSRGFKGSVGSSVRFMNVESDAEQLSQPRPMVDLREEANLASSDQGCPSRISSRPPSDNTPAFSGPFSGSSIRQGLWRNPHPPPSLTYVKAELFPYEEHTKPHYSNPADVTGPIEYAGLKIDLKCPTTLDSIPEFHGCEFATGVDFRRRILSHTHWTPVQCPPSYADAMKWLNDQAEHESQRAVPPSVAPAGPTAVSQIDVGTAARESPVAASDIEAKSLSITRSQNLTMMSIETFCVTRSSNEPDPEFDEITAILYAIHDERRSARMGGRFKDNIVKGVVVKTDADSMGPSAAHPGTRVECVPSEEVLLRTFATIVQECDPEILMGYEIQKSSLSFILARGARHGIDMTVEMSRVMSARHLDPKDRRNDEYGMAHSTGIHITGRIILNMWRVARRENNLRMYSYENVVWTLFKVRTPKVDSDVLTAWFTTGPAYLRWRPLEYFLDRAVMNLRMLDQMGFIERTSEMARVYGIDFVSVMARGSQYRVESMMARLAQSQNYVMISPTREQVREQPATESIPLVMEPKSDFYVNPVLVLDYQSLYPSVVISHNICYSTCLGKITDEEMQKLGVTHIQRNPGFWMKHEHDVIVTPNSIAYVKPEKRQGILPRLLSEILQTRVMTKQALGKAKRNNDEVLEKMLNARQLSLKLIANVTYGYTSANFSGRMPCADIADSIVEVGKRALLKAKTMVQQKYNGYSDEDRWFKILPESEKRKIRANDRVRVIYGDTDSIFVEMIGATREMAHTEGAKIAAMVTDVMPAPMKLQFEKVFHPSVMLTKKRYVGYAYTSPEQTVPVFDAKGIETVRRDGVPAVAKIQEKCLRLLFETRDVSLVKSYVQRQCQKIYAGRVGVQDFIFAREVKPVSSYTKPNVQPNRAIASAMAAEDRMLEPEVKERIPYVIVNTKHQGTLASNACNPRRLVESLGRDQIDAKYYIIKMVLPPLDRIFRTFGVDVKTWHTSARKQKYDYTKRQLKNIDHGAKSTRKAQRTLEDVGVYCENCVLCDNKSRKPVCEPCLRKPQGSVYVLSERLRMLEDKQNRAHMLCARCTGWPDTVRTSPCVSVDCPHYFERKKLDHAVMAVQDIEDCYLPLASRPSLGHPPPGPPASTDLEPRPVL